MINASRNSLTVVERYGQRYMRGIICLCLLLFSLAICPDMAYSQQKRKENKGQKSNAVSTTPNPKKGKNKINKKNKDRKPKKASKRAKKTQGNAVSAKDSEKRLKKRDLNKKNKVDGTKRSARKEKKQRGNAVGATDSEKRLKKRDIGKSNQVSVDNNDSKKAKDSQGSPIGAVDAEKRLRKKDLSKKNHVSVEKNNARKAKRSQGSPIGALDAERRLKRQKLDDRNNVRVAERGVKRAKRTQGNPIGAIDAEKRLKRKQLDGRNNIPEPERASKRAKRHQKNPIEEKIPVIRPNDRKQAMAITPKIPVIDHRKKTLERRKEEKKLMTRRLPKYRGLPEDNPIEYGVITAKDLKKSNQELSRYTGNMKLPTVPHAGRIARKTSRMILNFSGKLSIAKPANDRKTYYKLSRPTSTYIGDLRISWLHYHHRYPSLWRMGRKRDHATSGEVWRNRKMPKRSKYDPGERKIWQSSDSSTY